MRNVVFRRRLIERYYGGRDLVVYDGTWGFRVCGLCAGDEILVYDYDGSLARRIAVQADGCMEVDIPEDPRPLDFYESPLAYVVHKGYVSREDVCYLAPKSYWIKVPLVYYPLLNMYYSIYDSTGALRDSYYGPTQLAKPEIYTDYTHIYYQVDIYGPPPDCRLYKTVRIPQEDQNKIENVPATGVNRWAVVRAVAPNGAEKGNMRVWAGTLIRHRL